MQTLEEVTNTKHICSITLKPGLVSGRCRTQHIKLILKNTEHLVIKQATSKRIYTLAR